LKIFQGGFKMSEMPKFYRYLQEDYEEVMKKGSALVVLMLLATMLLFVGVSTVFAEEKTEDPESCVKAAKGPLVEAAAGTPAVSGPTRPAPITLARVGKPAPDFEASAYVDGRFKNIKLSD